MARTHRTWGTKSGRRTPAKLKGWHQRLLENLLVLTQDVGSQVGFARKCGIDAPRVSDWLAAKQRPSLANLHQIAEKLGISVDWLLFGEIGTTPAYREQSRHRAELEADLERAIARLANESAPGASQRVRISGKRVLDQAAHELVEEYRHVIAAETELNDAVGRAAQNVDTALARNTKAGAVAAEALSELVQRARSTGLVSAEARRQLRIAKKHLDVARVALEGIDGRQAWAGRFGKD